MSRLILASKSPWTPTIRREHALSACALHAGIDVDFFESPTDIRTFRPAGARTWLRALGSTASPGRPGSPTVHHRSAPVPGHRHRWSAAADNALLKAALKRRIGATATDSTVVVVNLPWQWAATQGLGVRRIFDAADDWNALLGGERPHVGASYARIAQEADAVIIANKSLTALFPDRPVHLVENGMPPDLVVAAPSPRPAHKRMMYVGTLSPRFDAALLDSVLDLLPGWSLDLFGECRYPGSGSRPSAELSLLLDRPDRRVRWHGVVARDQLGGVLDTADVTLVPNVAAHSRGQSSMKFGDYAARGRPIVSTRWETGLEAAAPPGTWFGSSPAEFAEAVLQANVAEDGLAAANVEWARARTWDQQWPKWSDAAFAHI